METSEEILRKINACEDRDRFVTMKCLNATIGQKNSNLIINPTEITDWVDLKCSCINQHNKLVKFNVEVKERNKNEEQLAKYPNAELKVPKLQRIYKATPKDTWLYYVVLLNKKTFMLFDLKRIDWSTIPSKYWTIRKCQMNPDSGYEKVLTYFIPYDKAALTMDCSKYYEEYEQSLK